VATSLSHVVVDANDHRALAGFWAEILGWPVAIDDDHEVEIGPGAPDDVPLIFVPVSDPKTHKSRVHIDLATGSEDVCDALIDRTLATGGRRLDLGREDVPWGVFADPEGNEFCITGPGYYDEPTGIVGAIIVTSTDHAVQSAFWSEATGWLRVPRGLHRGRGPFIKFGGGDPDTKRGKNRLHIDVRPEPGGDTREEAERLIALGATRVDIGQRDVPWIVLADPEGNEFCVLTPMDG
jgi:predicted enzyme related to lactoylglutathione lyase